MLRWVFTREVARSARGDLWPRISPRSAAQICQRRCRDPRGLLRLVAGEDAAEIRAFVLDLNTEHELHRLQELRQVFRKLAFCQQPRLHTVVEGAKLEGDPTLWIKEQDLPRLARLQVRENLRGQCRQPREPVRSRNSHHADLAKVGKPQSPFKALLLIGGPSVVQWKTKRGPTVRHNSARG